MNRFLLIRQRVFGLKQHEFAEEIGVSQSTVSRWENGVAPDLDDLTRIRRAAERRGLGWRDEWFFCESPCDLPNQEVDHA